VSEQIDVQELWQQVVATLKEGDVNRRLWDAADAAVPLAMEEDVLVLGMSPATFNLASYLETQVNRSRIREIMHARTGRRLDIRVMEGDTLERYEAERERRQVMQQQTVSRAEATVTERDEVAGWEQLSEQLYLRYTEVKLRRYPQNLAQFLWDVLPTVIEADERFRAEQPGAEAVHERQLGRILDKIGTYTGVQSTVVAMEFLRAKGRIP
jgi:hypothetical protein